MTLVLVGVVAVAVLFLALWIKAFRERRELERHSIAPEDLHAMLSEKQEVLLFDVRQPLDLLADAEIIPGARRVDPKEIQEHPDRFPKDKDLVVYCTCPSDATARMISRRARALQFNHIKFLKGGLSGWKQKGYPVVPYTEAFRLDTAT